MNHDFFEIGEGMHVLFLTPKDGRSLYEICQEYQAGHDDYHEAPAALAAQIHNALEPYT